MLLQIILSLIKKRFTWLGAVGIVCSPNVYHSDGDGVEGLTYVGERRHVNSGRGQGKGSAARLCAAVGEGRMRPDRLLDGVPKA